MDTAYVIGWIVGYAIVLAIGLIVSFYVIRGAILSALLEDRRRQAEAAGMLMREEATARLEADAREAELTARLRAAEGRRQFNAGGVGLPSPEDEAERIRNLDRGKD